ncbi:rhamnulokinase [Schaalia cardiffensis]|uniref:rhamnulokinase n=1 Tax=Schaalia cardiffensis TaxID=181487 RepID=UPI0018E8C86D|nr:rhamnulokinase family protein [Schaalia cardiffensis]MBJ2329855.1 rhamnulokinase [Schaalia cardiffensis]
MTTALAVDLGSASGRVIAGTILDGRLEVEEIHRFKHQAIRDDSGSLIWDVDTMWEQTLEGLKKAVARFPDAVCVSVDTWGVDFVPLDAKGERCGAARAYRDERTTRTLKAFRSRIDDRSFFEMSGNQPATINTANQLFAFTIEDPELAERTESVLFLPDYFAWKLTGVKGWSRSIASTSGLCVPGASRFNDDMFARLGIPRSWFGELNDDLSIVGPCTVPGLEGLSVVRGGAHDSACAVHGLPIDEGVRAYFLSCGSWSVLGALEDHALVSDAAYELGVTNESRTDGGVRPLFNITGMWILQEIQRQWEREGTPTDTDELVAQARECAPCTAFFDPDDPRFAEPGEMREKIDSALDEQGAPHPSSMPEYVRLIIESFARRYARAIDELSKVTGTRPEQLNLVGGGARNRLLCDLTASISGVTVIRGPIEASTLGSLIAQLETLGHLDPAQRSAFIAKTAKTHVHAPSKP